MFQAGCIGLRTSRSSNCLMCGVMPFLTSGEWSTGGLWMNLTWPDLTLAWFYINGSGGTRLFQSHFLCFRSAQWVLLEQPLQLGVRPMATCWSLYFSVKLLITSTWKGFPSSWKKNWLLHQRIYLDFHFSQEIRAQQMLWAFWNHRKWKSY